MDTLSTIKLEYLFYHLIIIQVYQVAFKKHCNSNTDKTIFCAIYS